MRVGGAIGKPSDETSGSKWLAEVIVGVLGMHFIDVVGLTGVKITDMPIPPLRCLIDPVVQGGDRDCLLSERAHPEWPEEKGSRGKYALQLH